jgi:heme/copper-type cytochrome/quinol oxidase subunit 2
MIGRIVKYFRQRKAGPNFYRLVFLSTVVTIGITGFLSAPSVSTPQERSITVRARQYGYDPEVIRINRGDTVRLRFISEDVVHGFYLEGYDLDVTIFPMSSNVELRRPSRPGKAEQVEEVVFRADRAGKFRYRCSRTCGVMHPFMLGELLVGPNYLFSVSLALSIGILAGGVVVVVVRGTLNDTLI